MTHTKEASYKSIVNVIKYCGGHIAWKKKLIVLALNILQTVRMNLESFKVTFSLLRVSMLFAAKCWRQRPSVYKCTSRGKSNKVQVLKCARRFTSQSSIMQFLINLLGTRYKTRKQVQRVDYSMPVQCRECRPKFQLICTVNLKKI